mmetsp:Transcript_49231/g.130370  ORF Transcript_49231/g.130370 Transcript_49231/m.130370 type:complete len:563 (-) Transcript_49231:168-1856(-)
MDDDQDGGIGFPRCSSQRSLVSNRSALQNSASSAASQHPLLTAFSNLSKAAESSARTREPSLSPSVSPSPAPTTHLSDHGEEPTIKTDAIIALLAPGRNDPESDQLRLLRQQIILERTERQEDDSSLRADLKTLELQLYKSGALTQNLSNSSKQPSDWKVEDLEHERATVETIQSLYEAHKALEQKVDECVKSVTHLASQMVESTQKSDTGGTAARDSLRENHANKEINIVEPSGNLVVLERHDLTEREPRLSFPLGAARQAEAIAIVEKFKSEFMEQISDVNLRFSGDNLWARGQIESLQSQLTDIREGIGKAALSMSMMTALSDTSKEAESARKETGGANSFRDGTQFGSVQPVSIATPTASTSLTPIPSMTPTLPISFPERHKSDFEETTRIDQLMDKGRRITPVLRRGGDKSPPPPHDDFRRVYQPMSRGPSEKTLSDFMLKTCPVEKADPRFRRDVSPTSSRHPSHLKKSPHEQERDDASSLRASSRMLLKPSVHASNAAGGDSIAYRGAKTHLEGSPPPSCGKPRILHRQEASFSMNPERCPRRDSNHPWPRVASP